MQEEVVNARITAHLSLALSYARRFSIGRKYLWNELVSEALFILTDAANVFHERHNNFEGYVRLRLRCGLIDLINRERTFVEYEDITPAPDKSMGLLLNDLFATDLFTPEEQNIIIGRLEGLTDQEIAISLRTSQVDIHRKRHGICQKVVEKGDKYGISRSKTSVPPPCRGRTGTS